MFTYSVQSVIIAMKNFHIFPRYVVYVDVMESWSILESVDSMHKIQTVTWINLDILWQQFSFCRSRYRPYRGRLMYSENLVVNKSEFLTAKRKMSVPIWTWI